MKLSISRTPSKLNIFSNISKFSVKISKFLKFISSHINKVDSSRIAIMFSKNIVNFFNFSFILFALSISFFINKFVELLSINLIIFSSTIYKTNCHSINIDSIIILFLLSYIKILLLFCSKFSTINFTFNIVC